MLVRSPVFFSLLTRSGDVGGQKTLRTYWKNYFEKTDTLIWVVDATDRERLDDCKHELHGLLQQEVPPCARQPLGPPLTNLQRLMGASLLVFKNKSDVSGCMSEDDIRLVSACCSRLRPSLTYRVPAGTATRSYPHSQMAHSTVLGPDGSQSAGGIEMGGTRR